MKIGIIGNGIVGTAVAATLKKHLLYPNSVTIIDDQRPHQTSLAGQGYLWSIHRCKNPDEFRLSEEAKSDWMQLVNDVDNRNDDSSLFRQCGSLLIAPESFASDLKEYMEKAKLSLDIDLEFIPDVSTINNFMQKGICGLHYKNDIVCDPSALIRYLMRTYDIPVEHRTVTSLEDELLNFDVLICCAGPWINDLCDVGVIPIRGILLHADPSDTTLISSPSEMVPMMEWGYGSQGYHFTLSSREHCWLIGASRENIGFDLSNIDGASDQLISHAYQFIKPGVIRSVNKKTVGFRPSLQTDQLYLQKKRAYVVEEKNDNLILCYGFEGQGVLYSAHAAKVVLDRVSSLICSS